MPLAEREAAAADFILSIVPIKLKDVAAPVWLSANGELFLSTYSTRRLYKCRSLKARRRQQ
jgi:hypothetical protein